MPRMTQEEYEADLAEARLEGFDEARLLVASLTGAGLVMEGLAGALIGQQAAAAARVEELRAQAAASRKPDTTE